MAPSMDDIKELISYVIVTYYFIVKGSSFAMGIEIVKPTYYTDLYSCLKQYLKVNFVQERHLLYLLRLYFGFPDLHFNYKCLLILHFL